MKSLMLRITLLGITMFPSKSTMKKILLLPVYFTSVFQTLRDEQFFAQAFIDAGVVTWSGELDLAPDAMCQAIK